MTCAYVPLIDLLAGDLASKVEGWKMEDARKALDLTLGLLEEKGYVILEEANLHQRIQM